MKEVYENLFVGNEYDYEATVKDSSEPWRVIHACKEPYHRLALNYKGRAASKDHPEYLIAQRDNRLILNLVDVDNPAYIPKIIIDKAVEFLHESLSLKRKTLVHCNQGMSRSPSIAMLYLALYTEIFLGNTFEEVEEEFRKLYSSYSPALGIRLFLKNNWKEYIARKEVNQ